MEKDDLPLLTQYFVQHLIGALRKHVKAYPPDLHQIAYLVADDIKSKFDFDLVEDFDHGANGVFSEDIDRDIDYLGSDMEIKFYQQLDGAPSFTIEPVYYHERPHAPLPGIFAFFSIPADIKRLVKRVIGKPELDIGYWFAKDILMHNTPLGKEGVVSIEKLARKYGELPLKELYAEAIERWFKNHPGSREEFEKSLISLDEIRKIDPKIATLFDNILAGEITS